MSELEWQTTSTTSTSTTSKLKPKSRVFVGNLPYPTTQNHTDKLQKLFLASNIQVCNIDIIQPKLGTKCFALVECNDVQEAIKCLDGVEFCGNVITVQKEKRNKQRLRGNYDAQKTKMKNMHGFGGGWSKPQASQSQSQKQPKPPQSQSQPQHHDTDTTAVDTADTTTTTIAANTTATSNRDDIHTFYSRCKLNIHQLMEEYGDFDPDFENMKVALNDDDNDTHQEKERSQSPIMESQHNDNNDYNINDNGISGMLGTSGNAPINVELVSFGYKYSVPPQARQGWSYSNPLSPIDCRDLPRCPHYVAKLSGLSFKVRKVLLSSEYGSSIEKDNVYNDSSEIEEQQYQLQRLKEKHQEQSKNSKDLNPLRLKSVELSKAILKSMEEAIQEGQHGYAFPLKATVFIGSEYGRHRSVVLCDIVAQEMRKLLRCCNDHNVTTLRIDVPVSVSLRHRDVDKSHKDEEAFGDDLRREHEVKMKRKKKQEWLESRSERYW